MNMTAQHPRTVTMRRGSSAHPFHSKSYREQDLLRAANIYNKLDKKQHMLENKLYAQSSINQVKLEKESVKY